MQGPQPRELAIVREAVGLGDRIHVDYVDDGWDSRVYVVNRGEAVFKFPRSREAKLQYGREVRVLDALNATHSPMLIPRAQWRHPHLDWFGYRGIVGQQLSSALPDLDPRTKASIGRAVGVFLRELHAQEIPDLPVVSIEGEIANYQQKYRLSLPALEALAAGEQAIVRSLFHEILPSNLRRLGGELRLTHADLGPWNIIVTADDEVGIIDFGDVCYCDPSKDFSGFGDDVVLEAALSAYGADDLLREKTWLRIAAFPILDIPFYLGKGDAKAVQGCLDQVRRFIVNGEMSPAARSAHTVHGRPIVKSAFDAG